MKLIATVLYEDTMLPSPDGSYPLHDFVMRLVEDQINGHTWKLHKQVLKNPRRGIGNIIRDVRETAFFAGAGELYLLVDRDVIAKRLHLPSTAADPQVVAALRATSDAPAKLHPYFLYPNLEGLLRAIQTCNPNLLPQTMASALTKNLNDRDLVLREARKAAYVSLRSCISTAQPGIVALAGALAVRIQARISPWP